MALGRYTKLLYIKYLFRLFGNNKYSSSVVLDFIHILFLIHFPFLVSCTVERPAEPNILTICCVLLVVNNKYDMQNSFSSLFVPVLDLFGKL